LELNAASAVRVHFSTAERRVSLEAGEAHFAVVHDAARPFVVNAGGVSVRAVGTAFNVRYAADGIEITVVEGKVRVGQGGLDSSAAAEAPLVAAGERLVIPKQAPSPAVEKISPETLRQALAWQSRLVEFAEAPLTEVVARFNARNRLQLLIADAELGQRRIGGTFALDEADAFVRLLERDGEIVAERRGNTEILLRRGR
jgi:transmembrane sensor